MRSDLKDYSFPSSSASQAGLFCFLIMTTFTKSFMIIGGPLGVSQFIIGVCFARVYFHCNYIMDMFAGMLIGIAISVLLVKCDFRLAMK